MSEEWLGDEWLTGIGIGLALGYAIIMYGYGWHQVLHFAFRFVFGMVMTDDGVFFFWGEDLLFNLFSLQFSCIRFIIVSSWNQLPPGTE